jgi:transposase
MLQVLRPEEEDRRQGSRELKTLTAERVRIVNRIKGLLFAQGVSGYAPLSRDRRAELEQLRTGDGRPLPPHLKRRIVREIDRLELLLEQIRVVKAERDAMLAAAQEAAILNPATMLIELKGIGPEFATVLWQEGLFRSFNNRRQIAALCRIGTNTMAKRHGRSRTRRLQIRESQAANNDAAARLALAAAPARLGAQPVVP